MHKKTRVKLTSRVIAFITLLLLLASVFPFTLLVTAAQHAENYYSGANEMLFEYICDKKSDISYDDNNVMSTNENPANIVQQYYDDDDYDYMPAIMFSIIFMPGASGVANMPHNRFVAHGSTIGAVPTPIREGYEFLGWQKIGAVWTGELLSSTEVENTVAISNIIFEARWGPPSYEYRYIHIYYYLQDENGELHRDMENNPLGRQYTCRVDTVFSLEDVLDRNTLPDNKVYVFEGWRIYVGETLHQNYLTGMDTTQLYGSFWVPAPSESPLNSEFDDIDELKSIMVGDIINLVAVWSYETKIAVSILNKTPDRTIARVGETINWSLRNFHNHADTAVSNFSIIEIPDKGLNFTSASLPAFSNSAGVTYSIMYRVYGSGSWQVYSSGINASQPFSFSLSQPGDLYYAHIKFLFGTVPANFGLGNEIIVTFYVGEETLDGQLVNNFWTMWDGNGVRNESGVRSVSSNENENGGGYGGVGESRHNGGYVSGDINVSDSGHGTGGGNIIGDRNVNGTAVTVITPSRGDGDGRLPQTGNGNSAVLWSAFLLLAILVTTDIIATIKRYYRYDITEK